MELIVESLNNMEERFNLGYTQGITQCRPSIFLQYLQNRPWGRVKRKRRSRQRRRSLVGRRDWHSYGASDTKCVNSNIPEPVDKIRRKKKRRRRRGRKRPAQRMFNSSSETDQTKRSPKVSKEIFISQKQNENRHKDQHENCDTNDIPNPNDDLDGCTYANRGNEENSYVN